MFRYLIRWFSRYQLLGFTAAFALIVIGFEGVAGLGLPALFWCREWYGNLVIGAVVAGFFALCSFIGFLLDHHNVDLTATPADLRHYFRHTIWLPTVIVAFRGVWRQVSGERCGLEWVVLAGYVIGLLLVRFTAPLLGAVAARLADRPWFVKLVDRLRRLATTTPVSGHWLHAYALLIISVLGLIYLAFAFWVDEAPVNAAVAICILLGMIVLFYGAVRFFIPRAMLLVVLVLLAWIGLANQVALKHRFEALKDVDPRPITVTPNGNLIKDGDALAAWRARIAARPPACGDQSKPKLVVVMTSGGGIRASVWTAAVLRALDQGPCPLGPQIRIITGASGGMVGAGYYVAARATNEVSSTAVDLKQVTADALDDVARYLALRDVPALFLPWSIPDRGFALENTWRTSAEPTRQTFAQLHPFEKTGRIPSLIYSPASLDDGRRVLVSNLQLGYMTQHDVAGAPISRSAVQLFELFPNDRIDVALAARMSASFPWVSSAAELPVEELRRIGDAGYWDNYGGFVTASWLEANRQWLHDNTGGVLIVQIRDSMFGDANRNINARNNEAISRAFSELVAPIQGVITARSRVTHFRNDYGLSLAASRFSKDFVRTVEIELPKDVVAPLSWNLTRRQADQIIEQAPKSVGKAIASINAWWQAPPAPHPAARTAPTP